MRELPVLTFMTLVGKEAMVEPYDVLFGGNTYDVFAAHATDNHPMHNFTKIVATSKLETLNWHNSTAITGDIAAEVAGLKEQDGLLLQVQANASLFRRCFLTIWWMSFACGFSGRSARR